MSTVTNRGIRCKVLSGTAPSAQGYLAGSDTDRARQLLQAYRDPNVKAVIAAKGGYGCLRTLKALLEQEEEEERNLFSKRFFGFRWRSAWG